MRRLIARDALLQAAADAARQVHHRLQVDPVHDGQQLVAGAANRRSSPCGTPATPLALNPRWVWKSMTGNLAPRHLCRRHLQHAARLEVLEIEHRWACVACWSAACALQREPAPSPEYDSHCRRFISGLLCANPAGHKSTATTSCTSTDGTVTVTTPADCCRRGAVPAVSSCTRPARAPSGTLTLTTSGPTG